VRVLVRDETILSEMIFERAARKMMKKKNKTELHAPGDDEFPGLLSLSSIQSAKTRTEDKSKTRRERKMRMRSRIEQILGREATWVSGWCGEKINPSRRISLVMMLQMPKLERGSTQTSKHWSSSLFTGGSHRVVVDFTTAPPLKGNEDYQPGRTDGRAASKRKVRDVQRFFDKLLVKFSRGRFKMLEVTKGRESGDFSSCLWSKESIILMPSFNCRGTFFGLFIEINETPFDWIEQYLNSASWWFTRIQTSGNWVLNSTHDKHSRESSRLEIWFSFGRKKSSGEFDTKIRIRW
jgi:hypothetical protein